MSDAFFSVFRAKKIGEIATPKVGLQTGENARFVRFWFEVVFGKISFHEKSINTAKESRLKWFPYNKGGEYRKWYGNDNYIVNWENDGFEIKHFVDGKGKLRSRPQNVKGNITFLFVIDNRDEKMLDFGMKTADEIRFVAGRSFEDYALVSKNKLKPTYTEENEK